MMSLKLEVRQMTPYSKRIKIWEAFLNLCLIFLCLNNQVSSKVFGQTIMDNFEEDSIFKRFDFRLVPEFQQVDQAIKDMDQFESVDQIYHSQSRQIFQSNKLQVSINSVTLYQLGSKSQQNLFQTNPAGLLLVNASLTNISEDSLYIDKDILKLATKFEDYSLSQANYFPLEFGLFEQIIEGDMGYLKPEQTFEGYFIFYLPPLDLQVYLRQSYVELIFGQVPSVIAGQVENLDLDKNLNQKLVLGLSPEIEEEIAISKQFIQDRVSQEWWGQKQFIAKMTNRQEKIFSGFRLVLDEIELTELEVRPEYKPIFSNFKYGQVLVTVSYKFENMGTNRLPFNLDLIEDNLLVNDMRFDSEPLLSYPITQTYLSAKEKIELKKVYVIDKMYFQKNCQDQDFIFEISMAVKPTDFLLSSLWQGLDKFSQIVFQPRIQNLSTENDHRVLFYYKWQPSLSDELDKDINWFFQED